MDIQINISNKESLTPDNFIINIETSIDSIKTGELIKYIENFKNQRNDKLFVYHNNTVVEIKFDDIISFFSDKKNNFCKTKDEVYRIKSKLYELENKDSNFIRISKSCIVNVNYIKAFDMNETGRIIVILADGTKEFVSRRKLKSIMEYLDERSV